MELEPMDTAELTAQQERYNAIARATSDSLALFTAALNLTGPLICWRCQRSRTWAKSGSPIWTTCG